MTHRALVVPAAADQPCTVIEWEHGGELLGLLYGSIGCESIDSFRLHLDGDELTGWVDDVGWYVAEPKHNERIHTLAAGLGQPRRYPVMGTVVLTGGDDSIGDTVGLTSELLADLQRALASPP